MLLLRYKLIFLHSLSLLYHSPGDSVWEFWDSHGFEAGAKMGGFEAGAKVGGRRLV